jgi:predicted ATP-grasp superfamily ATP-dependent carboligase
MANRIKAIVLDGEQRAALAVVRSLGIHGIPVAVGSEKKDCLASASKYCSESFTYPSPAEAPESFRRALRKYLVGTGGSVLLPVTDVTLSEVLMHREELPPGTVLPYDTYGKYAELSDKTNLVRIAGELGVPVPDTLLSSDHENNEILIDKAAGFGFPLVVKPGFSRIRTEKGWKNAKVQYARDPDQLRGILSEEIYQRTPFLIQKRIFGPGIGIFLLTREGEPLAKFAHRRIREKPPSGGVSVVSESIEFPGQAGGAALRILEKVRWTGVAMVEFKVDRETNEAKLLEINARFWGSLQLAVSSGVDFPYLLYRLALEAPMDKPGPYVVGLRSRWELGDLDHLLIRLRKSRAGANLPPHLGGRPEALKDFIVDFFRPSVRNEVCRRGDMKPFFNELNSYLRDIFG